MRRAAAFAIFGLLPLTVAIADVYRSTDAQGHVAYSDTPSPGAELVHVQNPRAAPSAPGPSASTASNASTSSAPPKSTDPVRDTLATQAAQQAVDKDLAATRAEQCTKATDNYNSSVQARRIYKTGADGEREYLTDSEADEQRLNLRLAMESACNNSP
jgi:hypothetical protein